MAHTALFCREKVLLTKDLPESLIGSRTLVLALALSSPRGTCGSGQGLVAAENSLEEGTSEDNVTV